MGLFILLFLCIFCCTQAVPLQELDCNDNEVFNAVEVALKGYNSGRRNGNLFALSVILEANRTAGPEKNFLVKYQIRETTCAIGEGIPWQKCNFIAASEGDSGECTAEVYIDDSLNLSSVQQTCKINPAPGKVAISQAVCLGCWKHISTKSLELQPVVKYGIELFNNESDESALFEVRKILSAERQVVAGWNYKVEYSIKTTNCSKAEFPILTPACQAIPEGREVICLITAYVHFTDKLVSATQKCKLKDDTVVPPPCFGCPVNISIYDPILQEPLAAALEKYNSESQDDFYFTVVQITKATSQVVAGMRYRIDFVIGKTNCSKAMVPKLNKRCTVTEDSQLLNCNASIYERAWESVLLPTVKCMDEQPKEHKGHENNVSPSVCPGCKIRIPPDSPILRKHLAVALEKYNSKSKDDFYYKVEEIKKATSQVVSGIIYRIEFTIKKTNCSKSLFPNLNERCTAREDSESLYCSASIYEKPWQPNNSDTVMNCGDIATLQSFQRRPPGFTPFRSVGRNISSPENRHTPGKGLALGHKRGLGHSRNQGHGHGHGHDHGHHHKKTKKESEESHESHEDVQQEIPNQQSTSEPFPKEQDVKRNANEEIFPSFGPTVSPIPLFQDGSSKPISLFHNMPELPEPPAPKCPGRPWKPITVPATPLQEDFKDFILADLLPALDEEAGEPHETTSVTTQQSFGALDLADALLG